MLRAFNKRPVVTAAFGFALGIALSSRTSGAQAVIAACLFAVLAFIAALWKKRSLALALLFALAGCARVLPYLDFCSALSQWELRSLSAPPGVPAFLGGVVSSLTQRCDELFPASSIVRAILLGDRSSLDYFTSSVFRDAGVAHVLALSGLHVSVVAAMLLRFLPKSRPMLRLCTTGVFLLAYCAVAGFPASLLRASFMTAVMLVAPVFSRRNDPLSSIALAFAVILAISPFSLYNAGFELSFSATAGILMLSEPLERKLSFLPQPLASAFALTLGATLGALPFTLSVFAAIPLYSLFSNLVVVPLMTLALPVALAALALSYILFPLGRALALIASLMISAAEWLCEVFAGLPMSVLSYGGISFIPCALFALALVAVSKYCLLPQKYKYASSALLVALSAASLALL